MGDALEQAKITRNAAHDALQQQLTQLREDLAARGIGGRIADRTGEALADAAEVANEHRGVIAGTVAAIALWFLRGPIIGLVARLWADDDGKESAEQNDSEERIDDD